jgi:hypothetical protein
VKESGQKDCESRSHGALRRPGENGYQSAQSCAETAHYTHLKYFILLLDSKLRG